jgi:hypothetical protein
MRDACDDDVSYSYVCIHMDIIDFRTQVTVNTYIPLFVSLCAAMYRGTYSDGSLVREANFCRFAVLDSIRHSIMRLHTALLISTFVYGRSFSFLSRVLSCSTSAPSDRFVSPIHMIPQTTQVPSWTDLQSSVADDPVGRSLNDEVELRAKGRASPHVQNKLRLFDGEDKTPAITLYRDHAGWCP